MSKRSCVFLIIYHIFDILSALSRFIPFVLNIYEWLTRIVSIFILMKHHFYKYPIDKLRIISKYL